MIKCKYPNLLALMVDKNIGIEEIANACDRKQDTIRKKIAGVNIFTLDEALAIHEQLFFDVAFRTVFSTRANISKEDRQ